MIKKIFAIWMILISSIYSYSYEIKIEQGWHLLGAVEDIEDMSIFDSYNLATKDTPEPESIWTYANNKWSRYSSFDNDVSLEEISSIKKGKGFWFYVQERRTIEVNKVSVSLEEANISLLASTENHNSSYKHFEMIRDKDRFTELYGNTSTDASNIDFETDTIIALIAGEQQRGYSSIISGVKKYRYYSVLDINTTFENKNCPRYTTKSSPANFVKYSHKPSHFTKEVILNENATVRECTTVDKTIQKVPKRVLGTDISENYRTIPLAWTTWKRFEVIQNQHTFDALFTSEYLIFNNKVSADDTKVDFNKNTMIAIFLGHKSTNSEDIIIKDILEHEDYIEILIEHDRGKSGCGASPILTSPFHLVAIPKTEKPFIFKETMVERHCVR